MNEKPPPLTQFQSFQHRFNELFEEAAANLDGRERAALAHYIHMRTSIELGPSVSEQKKSA